MKDLKNKKAPRPKQNKRKKKSAPVDWKKLFHRFLQCVLALGSAGLVVSGGFLAAQLLFRSDYFLVDSIRVENLQRVNREEILAFADIRTGVSIFDLDLRVIGKKIEENPWVDEATVKRIFPREVVIRVREHQPLAIVNLDYLYYLDAEGEVFKVLGAEDSLDFPVVTGLGREAMVNSSETSRRWLLTTVELLKMLKERKEFNFTQISEVHVNPDEGVQVITLEGGVPVHMGFDGFTAKLDRLERIFAELRPRLSGLKYIDLNVADRVIVKLDAAAAQDRG